MLGQGRDKFEQKDFWGRLSIFIRHLYCVPE